ncbi:hypothetical protein ACFLZ1_01975 [Patescibacteria group bacterium]
MHDVEAIMLIVKNLERSLFSAHNIGSLPINNTDLRLRGLPENTSEMSLHHGEGGRGSITANSDLTIQGDRAKARTPILRSPVGHRAPALNE